MFKFLKDRKKKDNKGFTLVELVIVVAILAILVGILAPQYTKYVEKSRKAADVSNLEEMVKAVKVAAADGTSAIKADTYIITLSTNANAKVEAKTTATNRAEVENAIKEFINENWASTKLKSSKWTDSSDGKGAAIPSISATIIISNDGSAQVSYNPTWMTSMADEKTTTTTATTTTTTTEDKKE